MIDDRKRTVVASRAHKRTTREREGKGRAYEAVTTSSGWSEAGGGIDSAVLVFMRGKRASSTLSSGQPRRQWMAFFLIPASSCFVGANLAHGSFLSSLRDHLEGSEDGGSNIKTLVPSNIAPVVCLSAALVAVWFVWRGVGRRSRSDNGRADRRGCKNSLPPLLMEWNMEGSLEGRGGKGREGSAEQLAAKCFSFFFPSSLLISRELVVPTFALQCGTKEVGQDENGVCPSVHHRSPQPISPTKVLLSMGYYPQCNPAKRT